MGSTLSDGSMMEWLLLAEQESRHLSTRLMYRMRWVMPVIALIN